jgi:hypothetical protein
MRRGRWGRRGARQVGCRWRWVLQAGGHSHVAQSLRGYGTQEMGVCRRDGGQASETELALVRASFLPRQGLLLLPPPKPHSGAGQLAIRAWTGKRDPVQGVAVLLPSPSLSLRLARPSTLRDPKFPSSSSYQQLSDLVFWPQVGDSQETPAQFPAEPPPSSSPFPGSQGPAPQAWGGGGAQLPLFPRRHSRDVLVR